jgi:hypothetical protein
VNNRIAQGKIECELECDGLGILGRSIRRVAGRRFAHLNHRTITYHQASEVGTIV